MEIIEPDKGEIPHQGCSKVVLVLQTLSLLDDDSDTVSMFMTIQCTRGSTRTSTSIPSCGVGDIGG